MKLRDPSILNTDNGPSRPPPGLDPLGGRYRYDAEQGERPIQFIEGFCRHYQGKFNGRPFTLLPWQKNVIRHLFGTYSVTTGLRRYRTAYIEIGKGAGKSPLAAALGLYGLCGDREPGAEVYAVATHTKQASIVFDAAKQMATNSPKLSRALTVHKYGIAHVKSTSKFEVLSGQDSGKHGIRPTLVLADELHEWNGRELWDSLESASIKRDNFLMLAITNAGWDRESICFELHEAAERFMRGESADETFFGIVWSASEDDDWTAEATWQKANPSLGTTVAIDLVRGECVKAKDSPVIENRFRRLYLSQWVGQADAWFEPAVLDALPEFDDADLVGRECYLGMDLSSTDDLTAAVRFYPPRDAQDLAIVVPEFFLPADNIDRLGRTHRVPYREWMNAGHFRTTSGNVVDYDELREWVNTLAASVPIRQVGIDRKFQGQGLENNLIEDGLDVVPVGQGWVSQDQPLTAITRLVRSRRLSFGQHPVMRWNFQNAVVKANGENGNLSLSKRLSRAKVDGVAALVCAVYCWLAAEGTPDPDAANYYATMEKPELITLDW